MNKPRCRLCVRCQRPFIVRHDRQRYCDLGCFAAHNSHRQLRPEEKKKLGYRPQSERESRRQHGADLALQRWIGERS